jgi:predicted ABC-type ATPase
MRPSATEIAIKPPTCWIIAGPNGAGKTTFALEFLPRAGCRHFINAVLIAAGLAPLAPERELLAASRLVLRELETRITARDSFAIETILAGRTYLRLVERLQQQGWRVELFYLALPSPEMSALRVAERVAHGGHSIPQTDIQRRLPRSLRHLLHEFSHRVVRCTCFMNHAARPALVFEQNRLTRTIHDPSWYQLLLRQAQA